MERGVWLRRADSHWSPYPYWITDLIYNALLGQSPYVELSPIDANYVHVKLCITQATLTISQNVLLPDLPIVTIWEVHVKRQTWPTWAALSSVNPTYTHYPAYSEKKLRNLILFRIRIQKSSKMPDISWKNRLEVCNLSSCSHRQSLSSLVSCHDPRLTRLPSIHRQRGIYYISSDLSISIDSSIPIEKSHTHNRHDERKYCSLRKTINTQTCPTDDGKKKREKMKKGRMQPTSLTRPRIDGHTSYHWLFYHRDSKSHPDFLCSLPASPRLPRSSYSVWESLTEHFRAMSAV